MLGSTSILGAFLLATAPQPMPGGAATSAPVPVSNQDIHARASARYEAGDYAGAIRLWAPAYAQMDASEQNRVNRTTLVFNMVAAHERMFELDADVAHLRAARGLLRKHIGVYRSTYEMTTATRDEIIRMQRRSGELDAKLEGALAASAAAAWAADPRAQKQEAKHILRADPELKRRNTAGGVMLGGGIALVATGIAVGAGTMVSCCFLWGSPTPRENAIMATAGGVAVGGAVLIVSGIAMRVVADRQANDKAETNARKMRLLPQVGPRQAGLGFSGRF